MAQTMNHFNDDPQPTLRPLTFLAILLIGIVLLVGDPGVARGDDGNSSPKVETGSELVWKSGDRLPGRPVGFKGGKLIFESALFREPLEIGVDWLRSFETKAKADKSDESSERFSIQLNDGQIFFADIKSLDENVLTVQSKRAGKFDIDRALIASIVNQEISQTLVSGAVDLDRWEAKRGEKRYWKPNEQGEVVATRDDIHLFLKSELPESCLIDIEIAWDETLDFALGLEIPYGARSFGSVPRLESWDGSIVFSHDDDFEPVLVELDEESKSLKLLIHWDRKSNNVVIHDELGAELASAKIEKMGKKAGSGIYLLNKNGDFRIISLGIRSAAAGFDPSRTSIQLKSDDAINATMKSFDGSKWTASKNDEMVEILADEFVGAYQFNPDAKFSPLTGDTLRFLDGEKVVGKLVAFDEDSITVETNASAQPIEFKSDRLKQLQFNPDAKAELKEEFNHVLISDSGKLKGRLESGSATDENVLFWRVSGATRAIPFASSVMGEGNINAKVILEQDDKSVDATNEWPDTLFLNNRDLLPVRFRSASEDEIVVDSFFENRVIPGSKIRAVEFGTKSQPSKLEFADPGWLKKGSAKLKNKKFSLKKGGTIGHPDLMGRGGFEFELDWPQDKYGALSVQCGRALDEKGAMKKRSTQSFKIMLYGQQYYVTADTNLQNPGANIKQRGGKAVRFRVAVEKDQFLVFANDKKCFNAKVSNDFGRSVSMRLDDSFGMQVSCDLSNLKLADGFLSGEFIDSERKNLVLTIPRLKARNPPGQILCATNFDLARGNIVSMNDEHVMFRTDNSVNRYPREILSSIVWIDTDALIKSLAAQETEQADEEPKSPENEQDGDLKVEQTLVSNKGQVAQVLMRGGRRVTLALKRWDEGKLVGQSSMLGECVIPFEQIYEIRMGKFATDATDVPWSDWIAKLAPKPKLDGASGPGQDDSTMFGTDSPLIGKSPKLVLSMLDGKKLKLESLKGKVVVLDFWATWCGPCVKSLPGIKKVIDNYPDSSVVLVTVNQNESKKKIESFLETRKFDLKVALDDGEISEEFNVEAIPQTVIIDPQGVIQFVKVGASNDMEKKLKSAIDSLLNAKAD